MTTQVLWVWNGWGLLFTVLISLGLLFQAWFTTKLGPSPPLRQLVGFIYLASVLLAFVMSGWVAGLLALPLGMLLGFILLHACGEILGLTRE